MKLPNAAQADIPQAKPVDYLLSSTHPAGQQKAGFFRGIGYSTSRWQRLAADLRAHAMTNDMTATQDTPYGVRYVVEGLLNAPDGRRRRVRVVWFISDGATIPRLVTAYPIRGRRR